MRADYSKLIADDKIELAKYQKSVLESGQTLAVEVLALKQKVGLIENGLAQMNSQYATTQRDLTSLHAATQSGAYNGTGDGGYRQNGKTKILESRLLKGIEKLASDRTKYRVWARDLKRVMSVYFEDVELIFAAIEEKNRNPDYNRVMKSKVQHMCAVKTTLTKS